MTEEIEPDAWLSESGQKCVTDSEKRCLEIEGISFDRSEPLYSAETIQEAIETKMTIERNGHKFVRVDKLKEVFVK